MVLSTASDLNSMTTTLSSPGFRLSIIVCPRVLKLSNERVTALATPFPVLLKAIYTGFHSPEAKGVSCNAENSRKGRVIRFEPDSAIVRSAIFLAARTSSSNSSALIFGFFGPRRFTFLTFFLSPKFVKDTLSAMFRHRRIG